MFDSKNAVKDFLEENPTCLNEKVIQLKDHIVVFNKGLTTIVLGDYNTKVLTVWLSDDVTLYIDTKLNDIITITDICLNISDDEVAVSGFDKHGSCLVVYEVDKIEDTVSKVYRLDDHSTSVYVAYVENKLCLYDPFDKSFTIVDSMRGELQTIHKEVFSTNHITPKHTALFSDCSTLTIVDAHVVDNTNVITQYDLETGVRKEYSIKADLLPTDCKSWSWIDFMVEVEDDLLFLTTIDNREQSPLNDYCLSLRTVTINTGTKQVICTSCLDTNIS